MKAYGVAALALALPGCFLWATPPTPVVEWPDAHSTRNLVPPMEAGAALAAAGAIRELLRENTDPGLFWGCTSPEQGLDVAVFTGPTPQLYYVVLDERFDRCGGPRGRVLDWWYVYAVTPQGEVIGRAPPPAAPEEEPPPSTPDPTPTPGP
ncbi:hypothetical protein [Melittangium boletus]|uniref:hypothetical protein n=1 Tax=Melittangium boletus TaxID=83453 RepID=UPI003DA4C798